MAEQTLIFEQSYDVGQELVFSLYREQQEDRVTVTLCYHFPGVEMEPVTVMRIFFPAAAEYLSPWLSWYNLICCSNNYGPIPVVSYMNRAVQNGKKVAATIYPESNMDYMQILKEVGDDYYCYPYHPDEYIYLLYISRKGTLADYFDLDEILRVYTSCDVHLDEDKMREFFERELSWFGNEDICPIRLHNCLGEEELAVTGLLFGYPVESTVALIRKEIEMCE